MERVYLYESNGTPLYLVYRDVAIDVQATAAPGNFAHDAEWITGQTATADVSPELLFRRGDDGKYHCDADGATVDIVGVQVAATDDDSPRLVAFYDVRHRGVKIGPTGGRHTPGVAARSYLGIESDRATDHAAHDAGECVV